MIGSPPIQRASAIAANSKGTDQSKKSVVHMIQRPCPKILRIVRRKPYSNREQPILRLKRPD
jgi:hypothetical protein